MERILNQNVRLRRPPAYVVGLVCLAQATHGSTHSICDRHSVATGQIIKVSNQPQLFLDDYLVVTKSNLRREIRKPEKYAGNPILPCEYPWEASRIYNPVVIFDAKPNIFRMWYTAFADAPGDYPGVICYAESDDGFRWRKPMMRIRSYQGRWPTNILLDGPIEALFMSVVKTPHDPARLYKGLYWHRRYPEAPELYGNLVTHSLDGLHWSEAKQVIRGKSDTFPSLIWYEPLGKYLAFLRDQARHPSLAGHIRVTGISESRDFDDWTPKRMKILTTEDEGYPYTQVHGLTVSVYGDLLLGLASVLTLEEPDNNFLGTMNVQLACSRDGWNWHRVADRDVFLQEGPDDWDRWFVHAASLTVRNDTVYVYYSGYPSKHGAGRGPLSASGPSVSACTGIGVATLPADRFVALVPVDGSRKGFLETPLLCFSGKELMINAEAVEKNLQIEILDEGGNVLSGFERSYSELGVRDRLRYQAVWTGPKGRLTLQDARDQQPLALRFILSKGSLYAFQIME